MELTKERKQMYESLHKQATDTPLVELKLDVPNGNRIFAKLEYKNPTGSHYDRVYPSLMMALEEEGKIIPGVTPIVETTSGNGGSAFARVAIAAGYDPYVILPDGLPRARVEDITVLN